MPRIRERRGGRVPRSVPLLPAAVSRAPERRSLGPKEMPRPRARWPEAKEADGCDHGPHPCGSSGDKAAVVLRSSGDGAAVVLWSSGVSGCNGVEGSGGVSGSSGDVGHVLMEEIHD